MNEIELRAPEYLWLIPVAIGVIIAARLLRRHSYVTFPLAALLDRRSFRASRLRRAPLLIAAAALPLIAVALSEPVLPYS